MKIKIDKKFRIYSFTAGSSLIIPNTTIEVKISPVRLLFIDRKENESSNVLEIFFDLKGFFEKFAIFQDLEKNVVEVLFFLEKKYFKYEIFLKDKKINLLLKRAPCKSINLESGKKLFSKELFLKKLYPLPLKVENFCLKKEREKLFLGSSKALNAENIKRRMDLKEIFPILFYMGQMVPEMVLEIPFKYEGVASLLKDCRTEKDFLKLFSAGFFSIFTPRLFDDQFQGIVDKDLKISKNATSLILLKESRNLIRKMFFEEKNNKVRVLPSLFPSFHSGTLLNIQSSFGIFNINWSKKLLKKMSFKSFKDEKIDFEFQSKIKTFRVRENKKDRGKILKTKTPFIAEKNKTYLFDRFCK